jgi:hypothetical protein
VAECFDFFIEVILVGEVVMFEPLFEGADFGVHEFGDLWRGSGYIEELQIFMGLVFELFGEFVHFLLETVDIDFELLFEADVFADISFCFLHRDL